MYTLLKIIKGTRVRNDIAGLPYMLHFMHAVCHVGDCLSYIIRHGCVISRVKTMGLGLDAHPHPLYKDWLVVSRIN